MNQYVQMDNYNVVTMNVSINPCSVMESLTAGIAPMKLPVVWKKIQTQLLNVTLQNVYYLIASALLMEPKYPARWK